MTDLKEIYQDGSYLKSVAYYSNGNIKSITWQKCVDSNLYDENLHKMSVIHKDNEPAFIEYAVEGWLLRETYYYYGRIHRIDGPALIGYTKDKRKRYQAWYYKDHFVTDKVKEWMKHNEVKSWDRASKSLKILFNLQVIELLRRTYD